MPDRTEASRCGPHSGSTPHGDPVHVRTRGTSRVSDDKIDPSAASDLPPPGEWSQVLPDPFRALLEKCGIAATLQAADGTILYASPAAHRMLGYCGEDLAGRCVAVLIHADDQPGMSERFEALLRQPGVSSTNQYRARHRNGSWRWLEATVTSVLQEPGVHALVATYRDVTERKQAEEGLRAIAAKARCLLWHAEVEESGGSFLNWKMGFVDEAAAERFLPVTRAPGQSFLAAWYESRLEEDKQRTDAFGNGEVRAGRSYYQEFRCRCADGDVRWLAEDVQIEPLAPGRWRAVGVCTDITERKRAEQALRESEASLARAQQIARLGSWEWDTRTNAVRWSDEIYRILGLTPSPGGPTYEALFEIVHPEDRAPLLRAVFAALTQGKPFSIDHRIMLPNGEIRSVNEQAEVVYDANGSPLRFLGTVLDITERKRAEEALQASEERYRRIVETAQEGVWTVDAQMRTTYVNQRVTDLLGYTAEEIVGRPFLDFVVGTKHPEARTRWDRRRRGVREHFDVPVRRKDGAELWMICSTNPLYGPDGAFIGSLAMITDVTERKQLEQQLYQAQKMEAIGRLAGGVAHDFNNMLGAINGYAELLLQRVGPDSELREFLQQIVKAGERATNLTRQLLAFSRKSIIAPRVLDLNRVIDELHPMLRRLIGADVEVVVLPSPGPTRVKADPGQIEQVLLNLAINARDAMPGGGRLTIETRTVCGSGECPVVGERPVCDRGRSPCVLLAVRDTGCGMDSETRTRIFEPFFTTKPADKGTGLGLATVYGIVQQSGGQIEVESEPGHGSTFWICFPACEEEAPREQPAEKPPATLTGSETILLVEDEPALRRMVNEVLRTNGYTVLEAIQGDDALRLCAEHPGSIDLLLTDVMMPGMSGRELAERAVRLRPETRVLFMSGYIADPVPDRELPGAAFIPKPFQPVALAQEIRRLLESTA